MTYTDRAIILKRFPYGEGDLLVTFLSANHGKFTALAKGVRKISSRRGAHLDLFNQVGISLSRGKGTLGLVREVETLENFETLRNDPEKIKLAFYFGELINELVPDSERNYSTYKLLLRALSYLDQAKGLVGNRELSRKIRERFGKALLEDLGYLPKGGESDEPSAHLFIEEIIGKKIRSLEMELW